MEANINKVDVGLLSHVIKELITSYCEKNNIDFSEMVKEIDAHFQAIVEIVNEKILKAADNNLAENRCHVIALQAAIAEVGCQTIHKLLDNLMASGALETKTDSDGRCFAVVGNPAAFTSEEGKVH